MNKTKKKVLAALLCLVLVGGTIGGTLAYLNIVTNTRTNVFTFAGISAELLEPKWDAQTGTEADANGDTIPDKAVNMLPGHDVDKDPQIHNTSSIDEYVAIRVTFQNGGGDTLTQAQMDVLMSIITIRSGSTGSYTNGFNTTDWTIRAGDTGKPVQIWYYTGGANSGVVKALTASDNTDVTNPLFDNILVKSGANDNANLRWLNTSPTASDAAEAAISGADPIGGLKIKLEGAAVQAQDMTLTTVPGGTAKDALDSLFP